MRILCLCLCLCLCLVQFSFADSGRLIMKKGESVQTAASPAKKTAKKAGGGKSSEKIVAENRDGSPLISQITRFGRKYVRHHQGLSEVDAECVMDASRRFKIPVAIILTILDVEGGEVGVRASNKNGTWDLGPMQVNTCHMEELKPFGISKYDLQTNGCLNVQAGTWLLRQLLNRHGKMLEAIGRYHSGNQPHKSNYQRKAIKAYRQLKSNPMKHIDRILDKSNEHFKRAGNVAVNNRK